MVSFVPTFEPVQPQEQVCEDQEPESTVILNPDDFFYIFIVDRSGSMGGDRIAVTKEAMKLFIKSLPPQSKFQVISFGDYYAPMIIGNEGLNDNPTLSYNEHTVETALTQINGFDADFGGTEIYEPLCVSIDSYSTHKKETRIFLLTDGQVSNRDSVIQKALTNKDNIRVYTFGIGSGCDTDLVQRVAANGRGSCSLVGDHDDINTLKGLVIAALAHALEPSL